MALSLAGLTTLTALAQKEELISELPSKKAEMGSHLPNMISVMQENGQDVLKIAPEAKGGTLWTVDNPKITASHYAVTGEIRYENVTDAYLEMWSNFAPEKVDDLPQSYFSRTLAYGGPMGRLHGSSGWRPFLLPFDSTGAKGRITSLVINLNTADLGTFYLRNVKLVQYPTVTASWSSQSSGWWTSSQTGWIGGIGGCFMVLYAGLIQFLIWRHPASPLIPGLFYGIIGASILTLISGAVAWITGQPYAVWYSLVLTGILGAGIFGQRFWQFRHHTHQEELRRIDALDS